MAIKIKNKSKKKEELSEEVESGEEELLSEEEQIEEAYQREIEPEPDAFQSTVVESAAWASTNPAKVAMAVALVLVLAGSAIGLLKFLEVRKVSASEELNEVFTANSYVIKDSVAYNAMEQAKPEFEIKTFDSEEARQKVIETTAAKAVENRAGESIAIAGYLAQASAQLKLGELDQAAKTYDQITSQTSDSAVKTMAQFGKYQVLKAQGKNDEALEMLNKIIDTSAALRKSLRYERARMFEAVGKIDAAKEIYHDLLDTNEAGMNKSDIERRLANLKTS